MNPIYDRAKENISIAIVAPFPPPYGGMGVQAQRLYCGLRQERIKVIKIDSCRTFPRYFRLIEKVKGLRTILRMVQFTLELRKIKHVNVVHIFGASFMYFFLVVIPAILISKISHFIKNSFPVSGDHSRLQEKYYINLLKINNMKISVINNKINIILKIFYFKSKFFLCCKI